MNIRADHVIDDLAEIPGWIRGVEAGEKQSREKGELEGGG